MVVVFFLVYLFNEVDDTKYDLLNGNKKKKHACVLNNVSCQGVFMVMSNYPIFNKSFGFYHSFPLQQNG